MNTGVGTAIKTPNGNFPNNRRKFIRFVFQRVTVMKRGRPNIRHNIQKEIIFLLSKINTPITISVLLKEITESLNRKVSWNTTQKYVRELVESGKVQAIQLPHSKEANKSGLVLYALKK